jgi:hypothetical protein
VDCNGDTLAQASSESEELLVITVDLEQADNNHIVNVPGSYELDRLADRRPELYEPIARTLKPPASRAEVASGHKG